MKGGYYVPSELEQAIQKTQRSYRDLAEGTRRHSREWGDLLPQGDSLTYTEFIQERDWVGLARAGRLNATKYRKSARELLAFRRVVAKQFSVNEAVAPIFEREFVAPRSRPDWPALSTGVRDELTARGRSRAQIARAIADLTAIRSDTVVREHRSMLIGGEEYLATMARRCFAGLMGAHLATTIGSLNRKARSRTNRPPNSAAFAQRTLAALERTERGYWRMLRSGKVPVVELGPGADLTKRLDDAAAHAAYLAVLRRDGDAAADDRSALAVGDALRALLRHLALRYKLAWIGVAHPASPEVVEWLRAAASLPFASASRWPRRGSVAGLARKPRSVANGAAITLEGTIASIEIRHVDRKPISTAMIRDARGNKVPIAAKYRKIDSSGMVPGSYVKASGTWTHRMPEFPTPVLNLDRLSLNELAESSWTDWVTARVRGIYEPSPQALAAHWSWQPGVNGACNQLRYRVWFAAERRQ